MKTKKTLFLFCFFATLAVSLPSRIEPTLVVEAQSISSDVLVGVEIAYDNIDDCKMMVDKVKNCTNLFVIGTTDITLNETKLNIVCQYIYDAGLKFIVFFIPTNPRTEAFDQQQWIREAKISWSNSFLGVYVFDEVGGKQIDLYNPMVTAANNYSDAAKKYVENVNAHLNYFKQAGAALYTAEYALYWFDYEAGFDVVLGEYAWNHSRPVHTALVRGAATTHNKEWGAMLTWTYNNPPYIESANELYNDMVLAYQNGAKYIVVFNYPKISQYGILTEEHFAALNRFWQYANSNPRKLDTAKHRVAYVIPRDYGWGFRGPTDKIWGLWGPDKLSGKILNETNYFLNLYQSNLDIVYDDPKHYDDIMLNYGKLIFWNGTAIEVDAFADFDSYRWSKSNANTGDVQYDETQVHFPPKDAPHVLTLEVQSASAGNGAQIVSANTYSFGTYEVRMQAQAEPRVHNYVSLYYSWSAGHFDDVTLDLNGSDTSHVYLRTDKDGSKTTSIIDFNWSGAMHVYKIEWTQSQVKLYIDGILKATVTTNIPDHSLNIYLSSWNSDHGQAPSNNSFISVDWIKMTTQS